DFVIGQPPQGAILFAHDWPEVLEPRATQRRVLREQEVAAPETLARDRSVRLPIDSEEDTRRLARLRYAPREHQQVSIGIGVHGSRAQRVLRQRHRVVVGVVVGQRSPTGPGLNGVGDGPAQIVAERGGQPKLWLRRRRVRNGRRSQARIIAEWWRDHPRRSWTGGIWPPPPRPLAG